MWAAGAVAAMSSITFPAVSALVSRTADADQQGKTICCIQMKPKTFALKEYMLYYTKSVTAVF